MPEKQLPTSVTLRAFKCVLIDLNATRMFEPGVGIVRICGIFIPPRNDMRRGEEEEQ